MLALAKTLTDWITWTNTTAQDEWNTWEEWQRYRQPSHYEKSDIFQYYLSVRSNFQPPTDSCISAYNSKYFIYCFGDFASLLVNPHGGGNILDYITLLLDVYDVCKGLSRRIKGDPNCIYLLREVVMKRKLDHLQRYNFDQHDYPYNIIHGHTVAQYSLSTLIMRFIAHYLSQTSTRGYYPNILSSSCQEAYTNCNFGAPVMLSTPKGSAPISIIQPQKSKPEEIRGSSWPQDYSKCYRCKVCTRMTENIWGKFDTCVDCHLKRICSVCGSQAVIISNDGLPKCSFHQEGILNTNQNNQQTL